MNNLNSRLLATLLFSDLVTRFCILESLLVSPDGVNQVIAGIASDIDNAMSALDAADFTESKILKYRAVNDSVHRLAAFVMGGLALRGHLEERAFTESIDFEGLDKVDSFGWVISGLIGIIRRSSIIYDLTVNVHSEVVSHG